MKSIKKSIMSMFVIALSFSHIHAAKLNVHYAFPDRDTSVKWWTPIHVAWEQCWLGGRCGTDEDWFDNRRRIDYSIAASTLAIFTAGLSLLALVDLYRIQADVRLRGSWVRVAVKGGSTWCFKTERHHEMSSLRITGKDTYRFGSNPYNAWQEVQCPVNIDKLVGPIEYRTIPGAGEFAKHVVEE